MTLGRIAAAVLAAAAGFVFVVSAAMALTNRFGASDDVHGYGLIFGTVLAIVAGLVTAFAVPFVVPRRLRGLAYPASMLVFLGVAALLIASLATA